MCRPRVINSSATTVNAPASALPAPNAHSPAHSTPAAPAPNTSPVTGSAVITPRPACAVRAAGVGSTVANAKAPASERITG